MNECDARVLAFGIDCEGYISIMKNVNRIPTYYGQVGLGCTDKILRDTAYELAGVGNLYTTDVRSKYPNWKLLYRWQANGRRDAVPLCKQIKPYLTLKQKQAENLIELYSFYSTRFPPTEGLAEILARKEELYQETRLLNKRGEL
jgi:hypothetical protein